jgi:hypothetical protein
LWRLPQKAVGLSVRSLINMTALGLAAAHMVGDYIAQTGWMAANKLADWRIRAIHVTCYCACFVPVLVVAGVTGQNLGGFLLLLWLTHFITDSRRWASGEQWPPKPILVDQAIHLATVYVLATSFGIQ